MKLTINLDVDTDRKSDSDAIVAFAKTILAAFGRTDVADVMGAARSEPEVPENVVDFGTGRDALERVISHYRYSTDTRDAAVDRAVTEIAASFNAIHTYSQMAGGFNRAVEAVWFGGGVVDSNAATVREISDFVGLVSIRLPSGFGQPDAAAPDAPVTLSRAALVKDLTIAVFSQHDAPGSYGSVIYPLVSLARWDAYVTEAGGLHAAMRSVWSEVAEAANLQLSDRHPDTAGKAASYILCRWAAEGRAQLPQSWTRIDPAFTVSFDFEEA